MNFIFFSSIKYVYILSNYYQMYKYSKNLDINTRMIDNTSLESPMSSSTISSKLKKVNNNFNSESKMLIDKKYVKNKQYNN